MQTITIAAGAGEAIAGFSDVAAAGFGRSINVALTNFINCIMLWSGSQRFRTGVIAVELRSEKIPKLFKIQIFLLKFYILNIDKLYLTEARTTTTTPPTLTEYLHKKVA